MEEQISEQQQTDDFDFDFDWDLLCNIAKRNMSAFQFPIKYNLASRR